MRVALASDHAALSLRQEVFNALQELGEEAVDLGTFEEASVDYPDYAIRAVEALRNGEAERAVIMCGTGIGISMAANRHKGIRAALCATEFDARMARSHNDANILALGGRTMGPGLARSILEVWLTTPFAGGRHQRRVDKIEAIKG